MAPVTLTKAASFRLDGKRALVTGGGRGIGLAAASALAAAGAHVTLAARTKQEIEDAASAIRGRGEKADHCSAVVAAKNENEPLSVRSDLFCETKAGRPNFFARQPVFAAVVAKRRPSLQGRDER